jgi:hypothetical protein
VRIQRLPDATEINASADAFVATTTFVIRKVIAFFKTSAQILHAGNMKL